MSQPFRPSSKLESVRYDIRGPLHARALEFERRGIEVLRLNIGNPGRFGFATPEHVRQAVERHVRDAEPYCHQQGLLEAREAVADHVAARGVTGVDARSVFIGNGVSELIDLALRALVEDGDEVLIPAPDYPLWTAATVLNGARPVHYPCRAEAGFLPDPEQIERLVGPRTRALVVINPNNPTGAVYPRWLLEALVRIAERHRLVLFSDEIYEGLLYDGARFQALAPLVRDTLCVSMSGLSKVWRACGYRVGWMTLSGAAGAARDYLRALDLLAALRLCSNVPGQWAVAAALRGPDTHSELTAPGGRLAETRSALLEAIGRSKLLDVVAPEGAMYAFPSVCRHGLPHFDDAEFALELLEQKHILIVPGSSFNVPYRHHFRLTLLPAAPVMRQALAAIDELLGQRLERPRLAEAVA